MTLDSPKTVRSRRAWILQGLCALLAAIYIGLGLWQGGLLTATPRAMGWEEWTWMGSGAFMLLVVAWLEIRIGEQMAMAREGRCTRAMVYRKEKVWWSKKRMLVKYYFRLEDRQKIKGRLVINPAKLPIAEDGTMTCFHDVKQPELSRLEVSLWGVKYLAERATQDDHGGGADSAVTG